MNSPRTIENVIVAKETLAFDDCLALKTRFLFASSSFPFLYIFNKLGTFNYYLSQQPVIFHG